MYDEKIQSVKLTPEDLINGISKKPSTTGITFEKVTCYWVKEQPEPTLNNVNLNITPGKLYAIIGPVGSGKVLVLFFPRMRYLCCRLNVFTYF